VTHNFIFLSVPRYVKWLRDGTGNSQRYLSGCLHHGYNPEVGSVRGQTIFPRWILECVRLCSPRGFFCWHNGQHLVHCKSILLISFLRYVFNTWGFLSSSSMRRINRERSCHCILTLVLIIKAPRNFMSEFQDDTQGKVISECLHFFLSVIYTSAKLSQFAISSPIFHVIFI